MSSSRPPWRPNGSDESAWARSCARTASSTRSSWPRCLAVQLDTPLVDLRERPSDEAAMRLLSEADARRLWVLPLAFAGVDDSNLVVATDDPSNQTLLDEVERIVGRQVIPMLSLRSEIDDAIRHRYRVTGDLEAQVSAFASTRPVAWRRRRGRSPPDSKGSRTRRSSRSSTSSSPRPSATGRATCTSSRTRAACASGPAWTESCARSRSSRPTSRPAS